MNTIPSLENWTMAEIGFLYGFSMLPVAIDHLFSDDLLSYNDIEQHVQYHYSKNLELIKFLIN